MIVPEVSTVTTQQLHQSRESEMSRVGHFLYSRLKKIPSSSPGKQIFSLDK